MVNPPPVGLLTYPSTFSGLFIHPYWGYLAPLPSLIHPPVSGYPSILAYPSPRIGSSIHSYRLIHLPVLVYPSTRRRTGIFIHPYWLIHLRFLPSPSTCSGLLIHTPILAYPSTRSGYPSTLLVFPFILRHAGIFIHPYWFIHPRLLASPFTCSGLIIRTPILAYPPTRNGYPSTRNGYTSIRRRIGYPYWLIHSPVLAYSISHTG